MIYKGHGQLNDVDFFSYLWFHFYMVTINYQSLSVGSPHVFELPYDQIENCYESPLAIATYLVSGVEATDAIHAAGKFAIGQTVGTWVPLPGLTPEMITNYQARVLSLYPVPDTTGSASYILSVAFPTHNFDGSFAMMQTALVGNDVSTAMPIKLLDVSFTAKALSEYHGPRLGVAGIRERCGVFSRPLVLNMVKPCIGHTPEQAAELFYESGMGGVDLIKDDEVQSNTPVSHVGARARLFNQTAERVFEATGKRPSYVPNITGCPSRVLENAEAVLEAGCRFCMLNFVATGLDLLAELSERYGSDLVILGHYAGVGMLNSEHLGYANPVMLGTWPRLAGADMIMTMFPPAGNTQEHLAYLQTVQKQKLPLGNISPVMTTVGGGVTPLNLNRIVDEIGNDVVLGIGGAIQGHPLGTRAGASAVMTALDCCMTHTPLEEAAAHSEPLQAALNAWG